MANIKSAKKRVKQTIKRTEINTARRSALKTVTKKMIAAVEAGDIGQAKELLQEVNSQLSRAKGKGILHANTAARKMSRLSKRVAVAEKSAQK
jgi:small subunit ribosomal protein S20